ncbi:hypothetical protein QYM36_001056 [Artemia franciscana]|uniref:Glutamine amidotransferase type-2 domain-containing protein n=1 Tax=Artemia franciscana TaxID=6661 RepID=A0AA88IAC7_ARTSF|nr:hypothetical protein QYM36_001056 [Artemia franciscana]
MCGIGFILSPKNISKNPQKTPLSIDLLERRGPNWSKTVVVKDENWSMEFFGSVLWLQGSKITLQPVQGDNGDVFLWNGDAYNIGELSSEEGISDTKWISDNIFENDSDFLLDLISKVKGPWCFVYYKKSAQKVYFGKDHFGRHSLLWTLDEVSIEKGCTICSCGAERYLTEVPSFGVFELDLLKFEVSLHPWSTLNTEALGKLKICDQIHFSLNQLNMTLPIHIQSINSIEDYVKLNYGIIDDLETLLLKSVKRRVTNLPRFCRTCVAQAVEVNCNHAKIAILFSGGLDSTILAALVHRCLPQDESVDLINVAFELEGKNKRFGFEYNVPDRISGIDAYEEIRTLYHREWNLVNSSRLT